MYLWSIEALRQTRKWIRKNDIARYCLPATLDCSVTWSVFDTRENTFGISTIIELRIPSKIFVSTGLLKVSGRKGLMGKLHANLAYDLLLVAWSERGFSHGLLANRKISTTRVTLMMSTVSKRSLQVFDFIVETRSNRGALLLLSSASPCPREERSGWSHVGVTWGSESGFLRATSRSDVLGMIPTNVYADNWSMAFFRDKPVRANMSSLLSDKRIFSNEIFRSLLFLSVCWYSERK